MLLIFNIFNKKKWLWKVDPYPSWFVCEFSTQLIDLKTYTKLQKESISKDKSIKGYKFFEVCWSTWYRFIYIIVV